MFLILRKNCLAYDYLYQDGTEAFKVQYIDIPERLKTIIETAKQINSDNASEEGIRKFNWLYREGVLSYDEKESKIAQLQKPSRETDEPSHWVHR